MVSQKSLDNLIRNDTRTREELQEMGRRGGILSGRAKRKKKLYAEIYTESFLLEEKGFKERFKVMGRDPERVARAIAAIQEQLIEIYREKDPEWNRFKAWLKAGKPGTDPEHKKERQP